MMHPPAASVTRPAAYLARLPTGIRGAAHFSRDGGYRFSLERAWSDGPRVAWIMLNPSCATAEADDPTLRRCTGFARDWGCGSLEVVNLFAAVATLPAELRAHAAPVGRGNDAAIASAVARADIVVAAWGAEHRGLLGRAERVLRTLPEAWCLGVTAGGDPRHPLRLARGTALEVLRR